jgi:hypothetical protein
MFKEEQQQQNTKTTGVVKEKYSRHCDQRVMGAVVRTE